MEPWPREQLSISYIYNLPISRIDDLISYRLKEKLVKFKKTNIYVNQIKYKIHVFENLLDGSEHFALIKGIKKTIPRVRLFPQML